MGGHICGSRAPRSVKELANLAQYTYTSIRLVALGVQNTYVMIWEDGTMMRDLKDCYDALEEVLKNCTGEDVSVSLGKSRPEHRRTSLIYFLTGF